MTSQRDRNESGPRYVASRINCATLAFGCDMTGMAHRCSTDRETVSMSSDADRPNTDGGQAGSGRQYFVPAPSEDEIRRVQADRRGGDHSQRSKTDARHRTPTQRPRKPAAPKPRQPTSIPAGRKRKRVWPKVAITLLLLAIVIGGYFAYRAWSTFNAIERVDLSTALTPATGDFTNYLLVGSDSRDELDPEGASGVTGSRADTMIILRVGPSGAQMMSIPRDLWVTIADTGSSGRINGSFNRGPANLVQTITDNLGIPVNHYVEVGFASFAGLVDSLGGVPIEFPHPAFDEQSGLNITEPGVHVLTGDQALAYARSRHFTEVIDGREVKDPTADLGRQERQQKFLIAALGALGDSRNPMELLAAGDSMSSELKVDTGLGMFDMFSLARRLGGTSPETVVLPTRPTRKGNAAVLVLKEPDAEGVLDGFR